MATPRRMSPLLQRQTHQESPRSSSPKSVSFWADPKSAEVEVAEDVVEYNMNGRPMSLLSPGAFLPIDSLLNASPAKPVIKVTDSVSPSVSPKLQRKMLSKEELRALDAAAKIHSEVGKDDKKLLKEMEKEEARRSSLHTPTKGDVKSLTPPPSRRTIQSLGHIEITSTPSEKKSDIRQWGSVDALNLGASPVDDRRKKESLDVPNLNRDMSSSMVSLREHDLPALDFFPLKYTFLAPVKKVTKAEERLVAKHSDLRAQIQKDTRRMLARIDKILVKEEALLDARLKKEFAVKVKAFSKEVKKSNASSSAIQREIEIFEAKLTLEHAHTFMETKALHQEKRVDFLISRLFAMFEYQMDVEVKGIAELCMEHFQELKQEDLTDTREQSKEREKKERKENDASIKQLIKDGKSAKTPVSSDEVEHMHLHFDATMRRQAMDDLARFDSEHAQLRESLQLQLARQYEAMKHYYDDCKHALQVFKETLRQSPA